MRCLQVSPRGSQKGFGQDKKKIAERPQKDDNSDRNRIFSLED